MDEAELDEEERCSDEQQNQWKRQYKSDEKCTETGNETWNGGGRRYEDRFRPHLCRLQ